TGRRGALCCATIAAGAAAVTGAAVAGFGFGGWFRAATCAIIRSRPFSSRSGSRVFPGAGFAISFADFAFSPLLAAADLPPAATWLDFEPVLSATVVVLQPLANKALAPRTAQLARANQRRPCRSSIHWIIRILPSWDPGTGEARNEFIDKWREAALN